ncbi:hypothetical protein [Sphingomonas sp. ZT3P38]|uniref:hypothetical protein n=1 Tax=Parasphingomonas zepuensis TaxID=3096161 RepID=UPI002FCA6566
MVAPRRAEGRRRDIVAIDRLLPVQNLDIPSKTGHQMLRALKYEVPPKMAEAKQSIDLRLDRIIVSFI